jgi:NitT/TauT family transport system substrate-binding protein
VETRFCDELPQRRQHNNKHQKGGFEMNKSGIPCSRPKWWIFLTAVVGWHALTGTAVTLAADKATVRIGVTNASSDVAFYIAENKGFFEEENLIPEYVRFKSGTDMVAPLAAGQLDVGAGGASAGLYNAAARGLELKIVADKGSMPPGYGYMLLLVRKDLVESGKFKGYRDLKGLKIGDSSNGGSGDALLNAALYKGGLKFVDVSKVYMTFPQLSIAFKNRAIDAALITEPNASDPVRAGDAVKFARGDEIYPNQALAVILYGPSLLKNRDVGQRFMNAYLKAVRI